MNAHNNIDTKNVHIMSRLMSLVTFFTTVFMEIYMIMVDTKFPYALEIISINFIFILSLLGIRGWISTKMMSISTINCNSNVNRKYEEDFNSLKGGEDVNSGSESEQKTSEEQRFMVKK